MILSRYLKSEDPHFDLSGTADEDLSDGIVFHVIIVVCFVNFLRDD